MVFGNRIDKNKPEVRRALYEAYSQSCPLCSLYMTMGEMQIDHIIPISMKGNHQVLDAYLLEVRKYGVLCDVRPEDFELDSLLNYMPMHGACNRTKWDRPLNPQRAAFFLDQARNRTPGIVKRVESFKSVNLADRDLDAWRAEIAANPQEKERIAEDAYNVLTDDRHPFAEERLTYADRRGATAYLNSKSTVRLTAYLPSLARPLATCAISFRSLKARNVVISLTHDQIAEQLLEGVNTPPTAGLRGFWEAGPDESGLHQVRVGATQVPLRVDELQELCDIVDDLSKEYSRALLGIEQALRCRGFSRSRWHRHGFRVVKVKRALWDKLIEFTREYDFAAGESDWHIFDQNSNYIKVYTQQQSPRYDAGYHVFLYPENNDPDYWGNLRRTDEDVWIVAEPQANDLILTFENIGEREAWDILTTHDWLMRDFLPRVSETPKRASRSLLRDRSSASGPLYESGKMEVCPEPSQVKSVQDLVELAGTLQLYYNRQGSTFLTAGELTNLYTAAATGFLRTPIPESGFQYIRGKLPFETLPEASTDLAAFMEARAQAAQTGVYQAFHVDHVLRCLVVPLRDHKTYLNQQEVARIAQLLAPFHEKMEFHQLLQRTLSNPLRD